jgi:hypothetical protein
MDLDLQGGGDAGSSVVERSRNFSNIETAVTKE